MLEAPLSLHANPSPTAACVPRSQSAGETGRTPNAGASNPPPDLSAFIRSPRNPVMSLTSRRAASPLWIEGAAPGPSRESTNASPSPTWPGRRASARPRSSQTPARDGRPGPSPRNRIGDLEFLRGRLPKQRLVRLDQPGELAAHGEHDIRGQRAASSFISDGFDQAGRPGSRGGCCPTGVGDTGTSTLSSDRALTLFRCRLNVSSSSCCSSGVAWPSWAIHSTIS